MRRSRTRWVVEHVGRRPPGGRRTVVGPSGPLEGRTSGHMPGVRLDVLTARELTLGDGRDDRREARELPPEANALLDIPAGYGGRGAWLGVDDAPALAGLLAPCRPELALSLCDRAAWEAKRLLSDGAPSVRDVDARDRFAAGLFDAEGDMNAYIEVSRGYPDRRAFTISALVVRPELRGCGIAGMLVEAVERWARAEGARALHLQLAPRNAGAVAFALRSGFTIRDEAALEDAAAQARLGVMVRRIE